MPTKKIDKKTNFRKKRIQPVKKRIQSVKTPSQTQHQVVNVYTTAKRTARKAPIKAPVQQKVASLGNTYYQPVSQAPTSFSLADVAKLIDKSKESVPQSINTDMPYNTIGNIPNKIPIPAPLEYSNLPLAIDELYSKPKLYEGTFGSLPKRTPVNLKLPKQTISPDTNIEDVKLKKTITKKPKKATLPLPNPPKKPPALIEKPINEVIIQYEERPMIEERTLSLLPPPEEILRQIEENRKPRRRVVIVDDNESENTVISTQTPIPKRVRRTKQQIEEAKQMKKEDIASRKVNV